jgi:hypothetical protein
MTGEQDCADAAAAAQTLHGGEGVRHVVREEVSKEIIFSSETA